MKGTVRIESVLLGLLRHAGLRDDRTALLVLDAFSGSATARRVLSYAAGAHISFTVPCPVTPEGVDREWTGDPVLVATVELSNGLGWRAGSLLDPRGTIPQTLAAAAIGRPVGSVISHPDIDPGRIVGTPAMEHASISVRMTEVELRISGSPLARLDTWRIMLNRRRVEKSPARRTTAIFGACALFLLTALANNIAGGVPKDGYGILALLMSGLSAVLVTLLFLDSYTGRLISESLVHLREGKTTFHEINAHRDYEMRMRERQQARGYDDEGAPLA